MAARATREPDARKSRIAIDAVARERRPSWSVANDAKRTAQHVERIGGRH